MFIESVKIAGSAVAQISLLGAVGYFLVRKNILGEAGLNSLSRLVIEVTLPILIFCQLIKDFRFDLYPDWWVFPLISIIITLAGLGLGSLFSVFIKGSLEKAQFVSLVTFQNSGYLPLSLIAALLPPQDIGRAFIYLFLFLAGFNLVMFSLGVYLLAFSKDKKFEWGNLFNMPVMATIISLLLVALGLNKFLPQTVFNPLKMIGDCTMPLAMLVVGGNLARIRLDNVDKKAMSLLLPAKLLILPGLGLLIILKLQLPPLIGLLILLELAVPCATTLSVIIRHNKGEDLLISQGIFFSHLLSIITLPLFLSIYFMIIMIK